MEGELYHYFFMAQPDNKNCPSHVSAFTSNGRVSKDMASSIFFSLTDQTPWKNNSHFTFLLLPCPSIEAAGELCTLIERFKPTIEVVDRLLDSFIQEFDDQEVLH